MTSYDEHLSTSIGNLPHNLVAGMLAHLTKGDWRGEHAELLSKVKPRELYALSMLLMDPDALKAALLTFMGKEYFAPPATRMLTLTGHYPNGVWPSDISLDNVTVSPFLNHPDAISAKMMELVPLYGVGEKDRSLSAVLEAVDTGGRESVDIRVIVALWRDYIKHEHYGGSGVYQHLRRVTRPTVWRIFADHAVNQGRGRGHGTVVCYPCIEMVQGRNVSFHQVEFFEGSQIVKKGDYLLVRK